MPMLTTVCTRLPVTPVHSPERTWSANAYILVEHGLHVGVDVLPVDDERGLRARRAGAARCAGRRGPR